MVRPSVRQRGVGNLPIKTAIAVALCGFIFVVLGCYKGSPLFGGRNYSYDPGKSSYVGKSPSLTVRKDGSIEIIHYAEYEKKLKLWTSSWLSRRRFADFGDPAFVERSLTPLLLLDADFAVYVWDIEKKAVRHKIELDEHYGLAVHPSEPLIAVAEARAYDPANDGTRVFNYSSGELIWSVPSHSTDRLSCSFSHDGKWIASWGWSHKGIGVYIVDVYDTMDGSLRCHIEAEVQAGKYGMGSFNFAWSPDDSSILMDGKNVHKGRLGHLALYDAATGKTIWMLPRSNFSANWAGFSADGEYVFASTWSGILGSGIEKVWSLRTGQLLVNSDRGLQIQHLFRDRAGRILGIGAIRNEKKEHCHIIDMRTGEIVNQFTASFRTWDASHDTVISVDPNGKYIAASARAGLAVWNRESGELVYEAPGAAQEQKVAFSPESNWFAFRAGKEGRVMVIRP